MFDIEEEIKNLPEQPGVYLMHDAEDVIIYVGKAKILKNRVKQYFRKNSNHTPKVLAMVEHIAYFEYIVTDSEAEALILECNLIKKYKPKYNILLKDDKHYPYIKVTINEDYPRIMMTRKLLKDGAKYYGPYMGNGTVYNTLDIVQTLFKPPKCTRRFPQDIKKGRPCLNYHINACFAPCRGTVTREEFRDVFFQICKFLDGNHKELLKDLKEQMLEASKNLEFEKAASLRDKIRAVGEVEERQKIINTDKQSDKDVIAMSHEGSLAFCEVFFVRGGKILGRESFKLENTANSDETEIMTDFVKQFYQNADYIPEELILEYPLNADEEIPEMLRALKGKKVTVTVPQKGEKRMLVNMVHKNSDIALLNYKARVMKEREKNTTLESLKELLKLEAVPERIESYDISNIHGQDNVGAMVVFENGRPAKRKYRKFKIKSFEGADDYAAMSEVIYRRFRHALDEEEKIASGELEYGEAKFLPLPDLILLDGGKGHVSTICTLMEQIDTDIPVFGMVKNDKHRTRALVSKSGEIEVNPMSGVFKLITYIQDEVHRSAITYHRKLHENIGSELDKIPGIGEKRRKALLTAFGSVDKIKEASLDEIENVRGMDKKSSMSVYNYFR